MDPFPRRVLYRTSTSRRRHAIGKLVMVAASTGLGHWRAAARYVLLGGNPQQVLAVWHLKHTTPMAPTPTKTQTHFSYYALTARLTGRTAEVVNTENWPRLAVARGWRA